MASDPRAKILRLLDVSRELAEKQAAVEAEIRSLITGEDGIGVKLKHLCRHYSETWETRYGTPYVFAFAKDTPQWKRLLRSMSVDEIDARILSFIRSDEKFYLQTRHPFAVFVKNINSLAGLPSEWKPIATGCVHAPPCTDGAACTARKYTELSQ